MKVFASRMQSVYDKAFLKDCETLRNWPLRLTPMQGDNYYFETVFKFPMHNTCFLLEFNFEVTSIFHSNFFNRLCAHAILKLIYAEIL